MQSGSWAAARLWARAELRARWRSIVALGLIAGVTAGLAIAAVVGSLQSGSALRRAEERTTTSTDLVFASQAGVSHPDWATFSHRPEVASFARWALVFGVLDGDPDGLIFAPVDSGGWLRTLDKPMVRQGRMFHDAADDEIVVADGAARRHHIRLGDTMRFVGFTEAENDAARGGAAGTSYETVNKPVTLHVVGIVRTPLEPLFVGDGFFMVSPGLLRQHPGIDFHENAVVQLHHPSQLTALEAHASSDISPGTPVLDLPTIGRRVKATTDVERLALALLAAAIALAGFVLVGQVVARSVARVVQDVRVLRAVGLRRATIASASTLAHLVAAGAMATTAVATAWIASRWLPVGVAARTEPPTGAHLDVVVVLPLTLALVVLFLVASFGMAWLGIGRAGAAEEQQARGPLEWLRRHAAPPVGIGATLALRRGRGASGLPVRPALLGAVVGVLGIAGALTLDAGLHDALAHPERAGVSWDAILVPGDASGYTAHGLDGAFVKAVTSIPHVREVAQLDRTNFAVQGGRSVQSYAVRPIHGPTSISLVLLKGHAPGPGQVVLGPRTAKLIGRAIGDTIRVGDPPIRARIVGTALFPSDVHSSFDEGVWVSPRDYDHLVSADNAERGIVLRVAPGSLDHVLARAKVVLTTWHGDGGPADVPPELTNLRGVLPLPRLLAGFLGLLALAALLHVLVTTTRLRSGEFAVLRALGFTRRSTRVVLNVQATTVFLVGLLVGAPLGVAVGRVGWRFIAQRVPLSVVPPLALVATLALVPVTLLIAQGLAVGPGRRISRLRTAEVLRAE